MGDEHVSGLAGEVRSCLQSDQFDLAGYTENRTKEFIIAAFQKPLMSPKQMVRFTFVVGGGKLVRSRYDDELPKWVCAALREIGFTEDKSAAETLDSQGTYKQQHDTGQNLKYVIVFPFVNISNDQDDKSSGKLKDKTSPEYLVAACEFSTFKDIVAAKVESWRQKKKLVKILQDNIDRFQKIEEKLISGSQLDTLEQEIYDSNTGSDSEKLTWLQSEIKALVDNGRLTKSEKDELLSTIQANLQTVEEELQTAKVEDKVMKIKKLEEKKINLVARKQNIEKITPTVYRLKHSNDIQKLLIKQLDIAALEEKGRSMSLQLQDLAVIGEKGDVEEKLKQLEDNSRGWFETDEDFAVRRELEVREANAKHIKLVQQRKNDAMKKKPSTTSSWSTVTSSSKKQTISTSSSKKLTGFAAAFDDDSD